MSEIRLDRWSLGAGHVPCFLYAEASVAPRGLLGDLLASVTYVAPKRAAIQCRTVGLFVAQALRIEGGAK
ncbi:MAG: hypothetical protein ACRDAM_16040 [Casimicrobium sp.]